MDPLSLAGSFATLVGLLANFKAERSGAELSDFMSWLRESHHEEIDSLVSESLLRVEHTSKGTLKYFATRSGVTFNSNSDICKSGGQTSGERRRTQ